jgi:3-hydroxybutyryl-CoA dehydrogenase
MAALDTSKTIAVIGAGTMGAGVAQVAAAAGHPTLLFDNNPEAVARGIEGIRKGLSRLVERGKMSQERLEEILANISPADQLESLAPASLVIEAIIENLEIKRDLFSRLEDLCAEDAILATNTSSLSVTAIAAPLKRPGNLVGMHFFNPAPIMKLVEVVSGVTTDKAVAETVFDTANNWGKHGVYAKSTPGFIVNRVARPFYAEALRALEEGAADAATLDAVMRESGGFRMGPFELMDLIGHDVNYAVTCSVFEAFYNDPRFLPSLIQKELVDGGLLGRKSGRGFFDYSEGAEKAAPSSEAQQPAPSSLEVNGDLGVASTLLPLFQEVGISIQQNKGNGAGTIRIGDLTLALTDGRSATQCAAEAGGSEWVLFDLALDYANSSRIALARADGTSDASLALAVGLFQAIGKSVTVLDDIPGLLVMRTVSMLANEAADAVLQQVCDAAGADTAMQSGVNYPLGPLAWSDRIGLQRVLQVLDNLQRAYGIDRYRPSQKLQRLVQAGQNFHR